MIKKNIFQVKHILQENEGDKRFYMKNTLEPTMN